MEHPTRIGKYQIEEYLGGGMSRVYRATDSVLGRRVAVKVLTEAATRETEAKARFLQEARLASNISHDNIIAVYDFGEENGLPFMVMEYLEGESLRHALDNGTAGDLRRKLEIGLLLGRALDHIHSKQIVHRDIKPENVHVDRSGRVKLMDFGIAKAQNLKLTRAGFTLGTPYYMAPEQVMGQEVTPQTDVYSFGILMYEMLAGVKPFLGEGYEKIFQQTLHELPSPDPLKAANVPQPVIQLVLRLLAKQPAQRPAGFTVVCGEIDGILSRLVPVRSSPRSSSASMAPPSHLSSSLQGRPPEPSRSPASLSPPSRAGGSAPTSQPIVNLLDTQPMESQPMASRPMANPLLSSDGQARLGPAPSRGSSFTDSLPPALRSPMVLMLLSALVVLALVGAVFLLASRFM